MSVPRTPQKRENWENRENGSLFNNQNRNAGHAANQGRAIQQQPAASTPQSFLSKDWKPRVKNTLRGFVTLETPAGLLFVDVSVHEQNGKRWISTPAKPWSKPDGSIGYVQVVDFRDKKALDRFQTAALQAIDRLLGELGGQVA